MRPLTHIIPLAVAAIMLAACGGGQQPSPTEQPTTILLGFRPDVQFAPYYVGIEEGFFADAGFDVTITHASESDIARRVATEEDGFNVGVIGGEQHLLARAQGLPLVYVYGWYDQYPIAIAAKEAADITTIEDLAGRTVGIPMLEGASYLGLTGILNAAGLTEEDIDLQVTGFAQVETLATDQVEAVVVYAANEPTQLRERGETITVLNAADYTSLLSNGLIVNEAQIEQSAEDVQRFVAAFDEALRFTLDNPDQAFEHSKAYVEGLDDPDVEPIARQVLTNSLEQWRGEGQLGATQPDEWQATLDVLLQVGLLEEPIDLDAAYTNQFVP